MSTANYEIIKNAILNRQQVIATYSGRVREMCPHAIGIKNGVEQALFYQYGGESSSGIIIPNSPQNWRCLPISGLTNIRIQNGEWHTSNNHSTRQTCVDIVDEQV
jgi:hypothetical protein